jgi:hypothetical protein
MKLLPQLGESVMWKGEVFASQFSFESQVGFVTKQSDGERVEGGQGAELNIQIGEKVRGIDDESVEGIQAKGVEVITFRVRRCITTREVPEPDQRHAG